MPGDHPSQLVPPDLGDGVALEYTDTFELAEGDERAQPPGQVHGAGPQFAVG
jgi:hypothetical protein